MWVLQISRINAFSEAITFLLENQNLKNLEVTQRISLNAILFIWNHFSAIRHSVFFLFWDFENPVPRLSLALRPEANQEV